MVVHVLNPAGEKIVNNTEDEFANWQKLQPFSSEQYRADEAYYCGKELSKCLLSYKI